jgi:cell division control protein 45
MDLHRAILRTGTALIEKRQIRLLRAYRLAVVKEGPDVAIFTHPNAVSKLALWLGDAILEQEREQERKKHLPLVVASLNERRGVYIVVGTIPGGRVSGGAKKNKEKEKEKEKDKGKKPAKDGDDEEEEEEEEEEENDDEEDEEEERRRGRNKFGIAFQEVASTTQARIRIDAFEATVVEVRKEDLAGFLEGLSTKIILG